MKRAGNLFDRVLERENLRLAVLRSLRGKRDRDDARYFVDRLDSQLAEMREQLLTNSLPLGEFHQFVVHVSSLSFRRQVLQQLSVSERRCELPDGEPQRQPAHEPEQQPGLSLGRSSAE